MSSIIDETAGRVRLAPLTVEQYEAMIAQGILGEGEPIELIDGLLVYRDRSATGEDLMTVGPEHQLAVKKLARLGERFAALGCHLSIQGPLRLSSRDEPAPDVTVLRGTPEDFATGHPSPHHVMSLIEVADGSLERDRTTKSRIYAAAGIRQYLIVNLPERQVELFYSPDLQGRRFRRGPLVLGDSEVVWIAAGETGAGKGVRVSVSDLLP
jgi:hypothetical protein